MISIRETETYLEVLKELNYPFGDVFIFKGFVVSEINEGVSFGWDEHAQVIVDDVLAFTRSKTGSDIVFITNRIHSYSVVAADWLKFFNKSYSLKAYCIVSENNIGFLNSMIEKLFFPQNIKHFSSIYEAINFVKKGVVEIS